MSNKNAFNICYKNTGKSLIKNLQIKKLFCDCIDLLNKFQLASDHFQHSFNS